MHSKLVVLLFLLFHGSSSFAQSGVCNSSEPFCTNDIMVFPAGVDTENAEDGPDYGCLSTQPNPAWYHMLVSNSGTIIIELSSSPAKDIDFVCWGPFTDPHTPCSGQLTSSKIAACSYAAGTDPEICEIENTTIGEYYILLVTNYANDPCSITFEKTGGDGSTDCNIVPGAASNNGPICEGETLELFAEPVENATYSWSGPGGFTSNLLDPSIPNATIANSGIYNLVVTLGGNSSIPYPTEVIINPRPNVDFNVSEGCAGELTNFVDLSTISSSTTPITNWHWDFGDGSYSTIQNPNHVYPIGNDMIYQVKLIATSSEGCKDSIIQDVSIFGKPVADFSFQFENNTPCAGSEVNFNNLSTTFNGTIEIYSWDFGDGNLSSEENPSHNYSLAGDYIVSLNVENSGGCDSTIQHLVSIYNAPSIDFSFTEVCLGLETHFYDTNFINVEATSDWHYDFDDGTSSDESNPIHTFGTAGIYLVDFTIIDTNGCSNNIEHSVEVYQSVNALFNYDTVCLYTPTQFTDLSSPSNNIDQWTWDFGDTETSILQNPSHIYDTAGIYNVSLIINSDEGCYDSIKHNVLVWEPPTANFIYSDTSCNTGLIYFNDSSYSTESTIINYTWNLPDGHVSFEPNTYFVFLTTEATYQVSLLVEDERGCSDTLMQEIYVKPDLQVNFSSDTVCFGDESSLEAFIIKPEQDSIVQYTWVFGDGSPQLTSGNPNINHEFLSPGNSEVMLQATNLNSCTHIVRRNVNVRNNPITDFSFQESYCYDSTTFSDLSVEGDGDITHWSWEYGDEESLEINYPNQPNHYHFYPPNYEIYSASLYIRDQFGCRDSIAKDIVHYPCVLVEFYTDTNWICNNTQVMFIDSTVVDSEFSISEKTWHFGDGNTLWVPPSTDTVYYQYQNFGNYEAKLIVGYEGNNLYFEDSVYKDVYISASPKPDFTVNSVCLGFPSEISDQSSIQDSFIEDAYWRYGDFSDTNYLYTNQLTHEHQYASDGEFPIYLHLRANNNCEDSITKMATVHPLPNMGFKADSTIFCGASDIRFQDISTINSGSIASRLWTFGDGDFQLVEDDTIHHYYQNGIYSVSLENTSDKYCKNSISIDDYILINPIVEADFEIEPQIININAKSKFELTNFVDEDVYVRWALSDTILWENIYSPNIVDSIFDTGRYEIKLFTINEFGCIDSLSRFLEVSPVYSLFVPTGFSPNGNGVNDTFGPIGKYFDMKSYSFRIFNQWGEMVFETNDFYKHWDGKTKNGNLAPIASYAYIIQVVDMNGNNKMIKGSITLLL